MGYQKPINNQPRSHKFQGLSFLLNNYNKANSMEKIKGSLKGEGVVSPFKALVPLFTNIFVSLSKAILQTTPETYNL